MTEIIKDSDDAEIIKGNSSDEDLPLITDEPKEESKIIKQKVNSSDEELSLIMKEKLSICTIPGFDRCKFKGAGIIPYTYIKNDLHFLMYYYSDSKKIVYTDFGGKVELGKDATSFHTAAREFTEETDGVLVDGKIDSLDRKIRIGTIELVIKMTNYAKESKLNYFYNDISYCTYMFQMDYFDPEKIPSKEHDSNKNRKCLWISYNEFLDSCKNKKLHKRLVCTGINHKINKLLKYSKIINHCI